MVELDRKIKEKSIIICNIVFFFVLLGSSVYNIHYSSDDYSVFYSHGYPWYMAITSYRPVLATVYWILDLIHINVVESQRLFGICLLGILTFSTTKITKIISIKMNVEKDYGKIFLLNIGTLLIYGNAFISEWFYFTEAYIQWGVSVVCITMAIYFMAKRKENLYNYAIV